ncbi:venom allergen 3-like [Rhynchophorus ferrugineus]|uniref:venom allergen 3-like n=1 Tax=Rhynchophorus ferrugineus TaxID=354439 RepID=UPI003FCD9924
MILYKLITTSMVIGFVLLYQFCFVLTLDYCKICKKGTHTLCKYQEGPSSKCTRYRKTDLSKSTKKYILDVHNDIRNHIASGQETKGALGRQPSAANMNILRWDGELEEMAQRWADQCLQLTDDNQHDICRLTERFDVGQNVLTAVTSSLELPDLAILILNWYKQVHDVIPSDIEVFSGIQRGKYLIGQYTQLVWAETRFVGCGISSFQDTNHTSEPLQYLHRLVCNYGPRGNVIGSSVYEKGVPCSKCPFGRCDSIRSNLCEDYYHNHEVFKWMHLIGDPVRTKQYFDGDSCICLYNLS